MNRRRLLKLAGLSLAGLGLPLAWPAPLRAETLFREIFGDARLAAHAGRLRHAADPNAALRGRALVADLAGFRSSARENRLRQRVAADLAALDVVLVDGWVMARAEADLCAAVYLDRSPA